MSIRDDMKKVHEVEKENREKRLNMEIMKRQTSIGQIYYEKFADLLFKKINEQMKANIKNLNVKSNGGFFRKKFMYETYYTVHFTIYPMEKAKYNTRIGISESKFFVMMIKDDFIHVETAYLEDIKKLLLYVLNKAKIEQYDTVLIDDYRPERYDSYSSGTKLSEGVIDTLISKLNDRWIEERKKINAVSDKIICTKDIIFQIECNEQGDII